MTLNVPCLLVHFCKNIAHTALLELNGLFVVILDHSTSN